MRSGRADELLDALTAALQRRERITLLAGSGLTSAVIPEVPGILDVADEYAANRPEAAILAAALAAVRLETGGRNIEAYLGYRRAFADIVKPSEFDLVAQQAVLRAYRPSDPGRSPLANQGGWQRVDATLGERLENDVESWDLPRGVRALGRLLVHGSVDFGRVLTTNFDPLIELAVRRAGGRAVTVRLGPDGSEPMLPVPDESIRVTHLHGYWRPETGRDRDRLLHDPEDLARNRPVFASRLARLLQRQRIVWVLGYSGWDAIFVAALAEAMAARPQMTVLWSLHHADKPAPAAWADLQTIPGDVTLYHGIDTDDLLPRLAERLGVHTPFRATEVRREWRHQRWERELISEPDTRPPDDPVTLLAQLDRRFGWEHVWSPDARSPYLVFWPVRLRTGPNVIHMAQALVAAALSARNARVVVCLDDFAVPEREARAREFGDAVAWWFSRIPDATPPEIRSLSDFIAMREDPETGAGPEGMLRPTRPWEIARELYGDRNPSVFRVLVAAKILPDIPLDELSENLPVILQALQRKNADRLLTPLTLFSFLQSLLNDRPTGSVVTLGGLDERALWELWRDTFDHDVNQVYNPRLISLGHDSLIVRWADAAGLRDHLEVARGLPGWDRQGGYFHWLIQNALLLPLYLSGTTLPRIGDYRMDSWAAAQAALNGSPAVLEPIAEQISAFYLNPARSDRPLARDDCRS